MEMLQTPPGRYAGIVNHWPCDLLAVRLAQSCYFFLGEPERSCELVDEVMKAWRPDAEKFGYMLAMASFAHAEAGHASRAEQLGPRRPDARSGLPR